MRTPSLDALLAAPSPSAVAAPTAEPQRPPGPESPPAAPAPRPSYPRAPRATPPALVIGLAALALAGWALFLAQL